MDVFLTGIVKITKKLSISLWNFTKIIIPCSLPLNDKAKSWREQVHYLRKTWTYQDVSLASLKYNIEVVTATTCRFLSIDACDILNLMTQSFISCTQQSQTESWCGGRRCSGLESASLTTSLTTAGVWTLLLLDAGIPLGFNASC